KGRSRTSAGQGRPEGFTSAWPDSGTWAGRSGGIPWETSDLLWNRPLTEQQLRELDPVLSDFLDQFLFCCGYTQTFAHLGTYVRGLLSDLPRKSVEAIAWRAGTPARTLQKFLTNHLWDYTAVHDLLQGHTAGLLRCLPRDELGTVGVIDEASVPKQG